MRIVIIITFGLVTALLLASIGTYFFSFADDLFPVFITGPAFGIIGGFLLSLFYAKARSKSKIVFRASVICLLVSLVISLISPGAGITMGVIFVIIAIVSFITSRIAEKS